MTMTTAPPPTVDNSTITSIPRDPSVSATEFQPLVVGQPPLDVRLREHGQMQSPEQVYTSVSF